MKIGGGGVNSINYSQWQREFSTSELKTVNHRTTLDSHIPDVKPRVKISAPQKKKNEWKPIHWSVWDNRERDPNTSPTSFTEPFFQHINLPCHAAKYKICKIHSGGLPTQWKRRASISIKNLFSQGETLGGLSRDGGGRKRNRMGLRNIVKAFNHRRAVRPGFSPTGAKRQMGSITALAGHTHTRLPLLFQ